MISVSDATIAGAVSYNGGYLIIDGNGKAVEQLTEYPTEYPEIVGLNISDAVIGTEIVYADNDQKIAFTELLNAIEQSGLDKITKIVTGLDALLEANAGRELDTASDVKPARMAGMLIAISLTCTAAAACATLCVMRVMRLRKTKKQKPSKH